MPFNVGDRVVCFRMFNNRADHGVVGTVYRVIRVAGEWHTLEGLGDRQVSDTRFELVERAPPAPPPEPEVEEPTVERISSVRYVVVYQYYADDPDEEETWEYEIWSDAQEARNAADEYEVSEHYRLIGTKKITLTFNVEI